MLGLGWGGGQPALRRAGAAWSGSQGGATGEWGLAPDRHPAPADDWIQQWRQEGRPDDRRHPRSDPR